jgi:Fe-coproporphyrin III synthase
VIARTREAGRRTVTRWSDRIHSLPILALSVHSACNCRCVMCDIWKANANKREIALADLERHVSSLRALHVQRVMLTGGEPLLHSNLWTLCDLLKSEGIRITLVTTGLTIEPHAEAIAQAIDEVVVSIDGPPNVHDEIRRIRGGFARIERGLGSLRDRPVSPHVIVRSVVQRPNYVRLGDTIEAVRKLAVDRLSFLAADVSSTAFNRPQPWAEERRSEIAVPRDQLPALADSIRATESRCNESLEDGFVTGGARSLWRIHAYYAALAGQGEFPRVRCNAPWVSAVLEPGDRVSPCFFQPAYPVTAATGLANALNSSDAIAFRRSLNVATNAICQRCVCSLSLPIWADA